MLGEGWANRGAGFSSLSTMKFRAIFRSRTGSPQKPCASEGEGGGKRGYIRRRGGVLLWGNLVDSVFLHMPVLLHLVDEDIERATREHLSQIPKPCKMLTAADILWGVFSTLSSPAGVMLRANSRI